MNQAFKINESLAYVKTSETWLGSELELGLVPKGNTVMESLGIVVSIIIAATSLRLAYLGIHVTLHPPEANQKRIRKLEFMVLGLILSVMVVGKEIKNQADQKHFADDQATQMQKVQAVIEEIRNRSNSEGREITIQQILQKLESLQADAYRVRSNTPPNINQPQVAETNELASVKPLILPNAESNPSPEFRLKPPDLELSSTPLIVPLSPHHEPSLTVPIVGGGSWYSVNVRAIPSCTKVEDL